MFQVVHCSKVVLVVLQVMPLLLTVCYVSDNAVHCFRQLFVVFQVMPLFQTLVCLVFQVMPLFVVQTLGDFPGLPGLFVACVYSAALRCVSLLANNIFFLTIITFSLLISTAYQCHQR